MLSRMNFVSNAAVNACMCQILLITLKSRIILTVYRYILPVLLKHFTNIATTLI